MDLSPSSDPLELLRSITGGAPAAAAAPSSRVESNARRRFAVASALAQGRMGFHYQPVVDARRPDAVSFHEMLARLTLPDGTVMPAGAFMPLVEATSLGRAIDRLALDRAYAMLDDDPLLRLSVNLSPLTMGDAGWLETLAARAGSSTCGRLILEITETSAMGEIGQTVDFMNHVRGFGCAFALDDFGAGATGFRHFRDFRFDMVKIDGGFVQGVDTAPDSKVLIECLMGAARHFEMFTVAERVETEAEAETLRGLGIDCLQGYLYGRPQSEPMRPVCRPRLAAVG